MPPWKKLFSKDANWCNLVTFLFRPLFLNSRTFPGLSSKLQNSRTFPGLEFFISNSRTFPGFQDLWEPCTLLHAILRWSLQAAVYLPGCTTAVVRCHVDHCSSTPTNVWHFSHSIHLINMWGNKTCAFNPLFDWFLDHITLVLWLVEWFLTNLGHI